LAAIQVGLARRFSIPFGGGLQAKGADRENNKKPRGFHALEGDLRPPRRNSTCSATKVCWPFTVTIALQGPVRGVFLAQQNACHSMRRKIKFLPAVFHQPFLNTTARVHKKCEVKFRNKKAHYNFSARDARKFSAIYFC
jgi:hypothetical protein